MKINSVCHSSSDRGEETVTQRGKCSCLKQPKKQLAKAENQFNTLKLHTTLNMNKVLCYKSIENFFIALVIITTTYSMVIITTIYSISIYNIILLGIMYITVYKMSVHTSWF